MKMQYSQHGLELTKRFEGCRLQAYRDQGGVWTIGYGHTGPDVFDGLVCTQERAEAWLIADLKKAVDNVNTHVTLPALTQGEFDALVDFAFNCGCKALDSSTLLKLVNANDMADAANEFEKWDHVQGHVVTGLLRRRLEEKQEFSN